MLLPSSDGGALIAGTNLGSKDSAAGETKILRGGVGGTAGDPLTGPVSEGHMLLGGIMMAGYLCLVLDRLLATLFRVESVAKLVGRLDAESLADDESENSVSLSLASYSSSKLFPRLLRPWSRDAGEEVSAGGNGGNAVVLPVASVAVPFPLEPIGLYITVPSSVSVPLSLLE